MLKRDPIKEFEVSPFTALVPFIADFATITENLDLIKDYGRRIKDILDNPSESKSLNDQNKKRLQNELEMYNTVLLWAGEPEVSKIRPQ